MTRKRLLRIGVYSTIGVVMLVLALHPYTRQLAIGPKVHGEPFCSWQASFRYKCDPQQPTDSLVASLFRWVGIHSLPPDPWPENDTELLPVVLSLANDPEARVRQGVAASLARYPWQPEMLPAVLSLARDSDPTVRQEIAASLAHHPISPETNDVLTALLDDSVREVRRDAMRSLSGDKLHDAAVPRVQRLMGDPDRECRVFAAAVLLRAAGKARDEKALRIILDELHASEPARRYLAAIALTSLGKEHPDYLEEVVAAGREDVATRRGYTQTLYRLGKPGLRRLEAMLTDDDVTVRCQAAWSFRSFELEDARVAIPSLVGALADPDQRVRDMAAETLAQLDPERYPRKRDP